MTQDELNERNKKAVDEFFRLCNYMEHLNGEHRTIIQNFFRLISAVIKAYAAQVTGKPTMWTDLRNEDSAKWAKEVAKIDVGMRHI